MDDTSACKIEQPESQPTPETTQTAAGLPVEEIVGTYEAKTTITVNMKGKDEDEDWREIDSEEVAFTYTVSQVEGNTIRLAISDVTYAEGPYDPATGICETTIAPDSYAAFKQEPKAEPVRITFSKQDGTIRFESLVLGKEDAVPGIATKVE